MKKLQLSLKSEWFEMTKTGIKKEDYRDITPYWCNRLLLYDDSSKPVAWWGFMRQIECWFFVKSIIFNVLNKRTIFKTFDANVMTLGYPKSTDSNRILKLEHKGIEIRTGNPEWGAEPNKLYFVIKHGEVIK